MKTKFNIILVLVCMLPFAISAQKFITQVKPAGSKFWGYANESGDLIIPATFAKCYKFSPEGYAPIYDQEARQYYFIDTKGNKLNTEIKDFKLRDGMGFDVEGFKNGLVMVKVGEKWGYMDTKGKLIIPAQYDDANDFNDGYAAAKKGSRFVVLNVKGEEFPVEDASVVDIKTFSEGMAPYKTADKKFGFIDTGGKVAVKAQYESVGYFSDGLAWAKQGALGFIDRKGEWVIKPRFTAGKEFDKTSGLARVREGESWGYVNKSGEMMYVKDAQAWGDFSEGLSDGKKGDKKGFYDSKGNWVIEPQFDGTRDFKNGFAAVKKGDKWGVIDKQGKWVIEPKFEGIKDMEAVK